MASSDVHQWQATMKEEFNSLIYNGTYTLVPLPPGYNVIQTRWLYKVKCRADGSVECYKAHWVVKGFSQLYSIDYNKTFAPVVHLKNLHLLLALATMLNLKIHQMDMDSTFLHMHLTEEIYITQPEGFISPEHLYHICHLLKSLYGLKQVPYTWNKAIDAHLLSNGFVPTDTDPCIYVHCKGQQVAIISLYVDDCTILASKALLPFAKNVLSQKFKIKDLGEAFSILGIEILRDRVLGTLELCQTSHIDAILHQFNMENLEQLHYHPVKQN